MTLIELVIAMAVTATVTLGLASMFQLMNQSTSNVKANIGAQSLRSSLIQIISNPNNCFNHLMTGYRTFDGTKALSPTGLPMGFTSDDGVSTIVGPTAPAGSPVPLNNYDVSVNYISFKSASLVPIGSDPSTNGSLYLGSLVAGLLKGTSNNAVAGGRALQDITIGSLLLAVDTSTNSILNCYAQPSDPITACASLGGNYVATSNPPCQIPPPCTSPNVFTGYDASGNPICQSSAQFAVLNCAAGQSVVMGSGGSFVCY